MQIDRSAIIAGMPPTDGAVGVICKNRDVSMEQAFACLAVIGLCSTAASSPGPPADASHGDPELGATPGASSRDRPELGKEPAALTGRLFFDPWRPRRQSRASGRGTE